MVVVIPNRSIGCLYRQKLLWQAPYPMLKMSVNGASTILGVASWVIRWMVGCSQLGRNYWMPSYAKEITIPSLLHLTNGHQCRVNDLWSWIFGSICDACSHTSINRELSAYIGRLARDISATASGTVTTHLIYNTTTKCWWAFYRTKTVKTLYISNNGHFTLLLTMMQVQQSLTLSWCSFLWWRRKHFAFSFYYEGTQYLIYGYLQPIDPQIAEDTRPTIDDTPSTLIVWMG